MLHEYSVYARARTCVHEELLIAYPAFWIYPRSSEYTEYAEYVVYKYNNFLWHPLSLLL